ncbi:MAG TPA: formate dehydrogenase accessory sulfurtransferase FdhD [Herpetosiphonaceae bacterium]
MSRRQGAARTRIWTVEEDAIRVRRDELAVEEPLEIRLRAGGERRSLAVTMRTPGNDVELALGFLYAEGVIAGLAEVERVAYCLDEADGEQRYNIVNVDLRGGALPEIAALERHFTVSSACGVCGKASLEGLELRRGPLPGAGPAVRPALIRQLPGLLRERQGMFDATGGLHAAALFSSAGELLALREDVGRHNALDKLIGWALTQGLLPLSESIVLVSGRASFELLQKCLMAGAPILCAISAPSSLAVDLARRFNLTLVGFLREARFNVYAGPGRVLAEPQHPPAG